MSFGIYKTINISPIKETTTPEPDLLTEENPEQISINFPYTTFTTLETTSNFKLTYLDIDDDNTFKNIEDITFECGDGILGNKDGHSNNNYAFTKAFQTCFDISAHFSIKLVKTEKMSLFEFEYNPDFSSLNTFFLAIGNSNNYNYKFCGGNMNAIIYKYDKDNFPKLLPFEKIEVINSSIKKSEDSNNSLQGTGLISINDTRDAKSDVDILLSISITLSFNLF